MSNVHIRFIEDEIGDLIDMEYFHHACAPANVDGWPAPEAIDYPVFCIECGQRVCEVPLSKYGKEQELRNVLGMINDGC